MAQQVTQISEVDKIVPLVCLECKHADAIDEKGVGQSRAACAFTIIIDAITHIDGAPGFPLQNRQRVVKRARARFAAMAVIASIPTVVIFIAFQRYFIAGLTMGSVKE